MSEESTLAGVVNESVPEVSQQESRQISQENPSILASGSVSNEPIAKQEPQDWYWAEGVKGEGPIPEGFDPGKYKYVTDAIKGINGMRKELSKLPGAPENYEIGTQEDLKALGIDADSEIIGKFKDIAKELRIPQDSFDKLLGFYTETMKAEQSNFNEELDSYGEKELEKLGPTGKEDIQNLMTWANNSLPSDLQDAFKNTLITADSVKVLNFIRETISNTTNIPSDTKTLAQDQRKLQLKQRLADPRYKTDRSFANAVNAEYNEFYG